MVPGKSTKTDRAMSKEIDPAMVIMGNLTHVDFDSYIGPEKTPKPSEEPPVKEKKKKPAPAKKAESAPLKKDGKPANAVTVLKVQNQSARRFRRAQAIYCITTGENLSTSAFLDRLLEAGMETLCPGIEKILSSLPGLSGK